MMKLSIIFLTTVLGLLTACNDKAQTPEQAKPTQQTTVLDPQMQALKNAKNVNTAIEQNANEQRQTIDSQQ